MLCTVVKINRNGKKCRNLSSSKSKRGSNRSGPDNGKKDRVVVPRAKSEQQNV